MNNKCNGKYTDLHVHTKIGSKDSTIGISELFGFARENDYVSVAIVDYYSVQGFIEAYEEKKKNEYWKNIKLMFGVELPVLGDNTYEPEYNVTILVKSQRGIKHLYSLLTKAFKEKKGTGSIPWEWIEKNRDHFLIGSSCNKGEVLLSLLNGAPNEAILNAINKYNYIELQPIENLINTNNLEIEVKDLEEKYKELISIAESENVLVTVTSNAHYINKKDLVLPNPLSTDEKLNLEDAYLREKDALYEDFGFLGDELADRLIENSNCISSMVNDNIRPLPKAKYCPKLQEGYKYIEDICILAVRNIYGDNLPKEIAKRLTFELQSIKEFNTSVHFVVAKKLVDMAKSDGYTVGSRGTVGSSLVAFLMGITDINPLPPHYVCPKCKRVEFASEKGFSIGPDLPDNTCTACNTTMNKYGFNIPAESFFSIDGSKEPDIDLNFAPEYQDKAIECITKIFGKDKVARAGSVTDHLINHPGRVLVCPKGHSMSDFTPLEYLGGSRIGTTHFNYHSLDKNLVMFDLLTNNSLSFLKKLQDVTGCSPEDIPLDDERVISVFSGIDGLDEKKSNLDEFMGTTGIPDFDNPYVENMLIELQPKSLDDLIRVNGLYHGTGTWVENAEDIVGNGIAKLSDIISTREDIMNFLIERGIDKEESYRIMEKVRRGKSLSDLHLKLMREHDIPEWFIDSCERIGYLFPKGHCVQYTLTAYRLAWFKVYYPKEFYETMMEITHGAK